MSQLGPNAEAAALPGQAARLALDRALASPEFRLSVRMSQLLRYLVEATLSNRSAELKETIVGIDVFGRPADYDPKIDPVVRKEARRLRLKLQEYYLGSGAAEAVRIDLPKGGYVPIFLPAAAPVAEPPAARPRSRMRWLLPAAAAAGLLAVSLFALRMDLNRPVLVPEMLTGNSGDELHPSFSPDGKQIAFSWQPETGAMPAIYVQTLHGDAPRRLTSSGDFEDHPAWSPDGKQIAFLRRTAGGSYAVCLRSLGDGTERTLTEISKSDHLDWSPDGQTIATSDAVGGSRTSIVFVAAATGGRRQITVPPPGLGDGFPRFSPDGSRFAFLRSANADAEVYLMTPKSSQPPKQLTFENRKVEGFTWLPDGRTLVLSLARGATSRSLWLLPVNGGSMERIAAAGTNVFYPAISPKGGALAFVLTRTDINIWRVRTDTSGPPAIVADSSVLDSSPTVSPDGAQVAFRSSRSGTNEIWKTGLFENHPSRLTRINGPLTGSPSWSPDGKWIAFDSRVNGNSDVLLAASIGGPPRTLTQASSNEIIPRWSHDSQWIYFGSDRSGRWQIWKQRLSSGDAEQVTWAGGYAAAESPDGRYVYYTRGLNETGLYRIPAGGGEEEAILPSLAGKLWGNWVPTVDGVYYLDYPDRDASTNSTIRYLDLRSKQTRTVYRLPKHPVLWDGGLALSPDGKWLVFAELDYAGSSIQLLEPFQ